MFSLLLTLAVVDSSPAQAAEVEWKGHYRSRGLLYNSLSLSQTNPNALGTSAFMDHRLRLQPAFHVNSNIGVYAQVDYLPLNVWASTANTYYDPVTGENIALAYADGVSPNNDPDNGGSYLGNLTLTRAYADVYTPIGRLRFGRMPLDWGAGILLNDGLDPEDEFGDTGDRIQFTSRAGPVYVMGGFEVQSEGYLDVSDDMMIVDLAVAYRAETVALGLYNRYRFQPSADFRSYTGDLWGYAELGPAKIEAEFAGIFGRGDLDTGANDIGIISGGGILRGTMDTETIFGGLELGFATGDNDTNDSTLRTFTMDRDHNPALMMFEEPMPLLAPAVTNSSNGGRDEGAVRTGEGVRNALYLRPSVGYNFRPDLAGGIALISARAASLPDSESESKGYGTELDFDLKYSPLENFYAKGTFGVFFPGTYYSNFEDENLGGGFDSATFGGRLYLTVNF